MLLLLDHTMGGNPGGREGRVPHDFEGGDTISNVPPPPRFCGRTIFRRKNRFLTNLLTLFFFACQNVGFGSTGTPNLSQKNCQRRWRCEKKKSVGDPPPPPPAHQLFWELRDYGLAASPPPLICC